MSTAAKIIGQDNLLPLQDDDEVTLRFDDAHPLQQNFEEKVQRAQEQLLHLRQQQQHIERHKTELEELSQKQHRFVRGRTDLTERLNRALAMLDRETYDAQNRIELLEHLKGSFSRHLSILDELNPESWSRADLRTELNQALGAIEDAEDDYQKSMAKLTATAPVPRREAGGEAGPESRGTGGLADALAARGFGFWLKCGFAFTLPIMAFLLLALVVRAFFSM